MYDSYLVDVYGVLYDGASFWPSALDLLKKMKDSGRNVVILSNTTMVSTVCEERYKQKGLVKGVHYNEFISSGEAFKCTIADSVPNASAYYQIFSKNMEIFADTNLVEVQSAEDADFVYVGVVNGAGKTYTADDLQRHDGTLVPMDEITSTNCRDIRGLEEICKILETCLKHDKPLAVANPDIFAHETVATPTGYEKRLVLCQGAIGEFYELMGGRVIYFGKPYQQIYNFAKKFLGSCERTAMIGDTLWTDILGGNAANVNTVLTLTGVTTEFFRTMDAGNTTEEKLSRLVSEIAPKMAHEALLKFSMTPTYVVESFAL
jgi:HAD superfamily hydrolase (TIGR01450 family)